MDTGYFGNRANPQNPNGWKVWHRVVPNNFQHGEIIDRPPDRWQRHRIKPQQRRRGSRILIAAPDEKPCTVYGITLDSWLDATLHTIRQHTDRPIQIRQRDPNRQNRLANDFTQALEDVHAVVTFNSNAAVESVLAGVPVFVTAPCSAALPVANRDLSTIHDPWFPEMDMIEAWCRHLAYGQFHNTELANGVARNILEKEWPN
jgi:hypothetical protein